MPLYLVTSLYDEGISTTNFRVVEAASKRDIAVHMLAHPEQWAFFLQRALPRDWRGAGPHLGSLLDCTHDPAMTPERFLELIDMTWVDGDSAAQLAIHHITVSPLAAVDTQPKFAREAEKGMVMHEPRKILIAYDGSSAANAALDDLRWAGLPREAAVLLLTVVDVGLRLPAPEESDTSRAATLDIIGLYKARQQLAPAVEEARALGGQAGERVRADFPDWDVRVEAVADAPAAAILRLADEWPADLIVVGAQGRSALSRLLLGSVSQKVVTAAACSVRIARGRAGHNTSSLRIAVGVDGSAEAAAAVRAVAQRVWPAGTEACVFATQNRYWTADDVRQWYHSKVDAAVKELRTAGLTASSVLREGHPQRVLLEESARWGADCVFVGSRGLGQVKRFLLGSVSAAVAARAQCSVEVVRTAA